MENVEVNKEAKPFNPVISIGYPKHKQTSITN